MVTSGDGLDGLNNQIHTTDEDVAEGDESEDVSMSNDGDSSSRKSQTQNEAIVRHAIGEVQN